MKKIQFLFAAIATGFIISCSPTVHVQKDDSVNLGKYKTYSWVDTRYNENDNTKRPASYADIPVRNAANEELRRLGWREVSNDPDAFISYDVLVERGVVQQSDPVYSQSFTRSYYNPRMRRWSTIYYPSQFLGYNSYDVPVKEGTITITITDAMTDKIAWQGWTTESLNYTRLSQDEITSSVKNIFSKFDAAVK
jgi:hypothetical protein